MSHYKKANHKECIDEMREQFSDYAVYCFCICNAYKYVYRAGLKENNPAVQDYCKAKYYIDYANKLCDEHKLQPLFRRVNLKTFKGAI